MSALELLVDEYQCQLRFSLLRILCLLLLFRSQIYIQSDLQEGIWREYVWWKLLNLILDVPQGHISVRQVKIFDVLLGDPPSTSIHFEGTSHEYCRQFVILSVADGSP